MPAATKGCNIQVNDLSVYLKIQTRPLHILHDISITIEPGQIVSILGPSGSGKSTLLRVLCDLVQPSFGKVFLNDLSPAQARKQQWIGLVPQKPTLFPNRTVLENVQLPLDITRIEPAIPLDTILELVHLLEFRAAYPAELSGGMQQRTALARALVTQPKLLLMDEPFSALDEPLREELQGEFLQIQRQMRQTVVFVTHSIEEAVFMANKIVIFTPLPGQVKHIVDLPFRRTPGEDLRVSQEYFASVKLVRELLKL